jgi:hypothetical protein
MTNFVLKNKKSHTQPNPIQQIFLDRKKTFPVEEQEHIFLFIEATTEKNSQFIMPIK